MSQAEEVSVEQVVAPEIPRQGWDTLIVLQRHGQYDNRRPLNTGNLAEEEKIYGRLTEEGKAEAKKRTDERIQAILSQSLEKTDFLILNSPTYWLDNEQLGQRARETAEIIAAEVVDNLQSHGLPPEQLLNNSGKFKGDVSRPDNRLGEALMFQIPEFVGALREKYGGQGTEFWENFNRDTHKELRENLGAEGPIEIADRLNESINVVARFARLYHGLNPDRKLVVWMVTHGDGLVPYVQRALGVPEEDFSAGYDEGIGIAIDSGGNATVNIRRKEYKVPLAPYGYPITAQSN